MSGKGQSHSRYSYLNVILDLKSDYMQSFYQIWLYAELLPDVCRTLKPLDKVSLKKHR